MDKLFIVDASNYLFRSYFAIRKMTNDKGISTNALFGFIRSVQKLIKDFEVANLVVVFDGPNNKESRTELYADYKGHRAACPEDLIPQIAFAKTFCDLSGISHVEIPRYEADDAMGSIAQWAEREGSSVYICSSDKDLCQLVTDRIFVLNTFKENLIIDREGVKKIYGVLPEQIIDYLAIVGDSSDNIPGIPGFGPKTAADLLSTFGSLNVICAHPEQLQNKTREEKIKQGLETIRISQKLATIHTTLSIPEAKEFYHIKAIDPLKLTAFYQEMNFNSLLKEFEANKPKAPKGESPSNYHLVNDENSLEDLFKLLSSEQEICLDVESTTLQPLSAALVGIGLGVKAEEAWYIPFNGALDPKLIVEKLTALFTDPSKRFYGHNIKYDLHVLANHNIPLPQISFDTLVASHLLNTSSTRHGLDELTLEKFGHSKIPIESLIGKKKKGEQGSMQDVALPTIAEYCCEDIDYTIRLKLLFTDELQERKLWKLFEEMEMPLLPVLLRMERAGICVNREKLSLLSVEFTQKIDELQTEIFTLAGKSFNLNSPKQLSELLFTDLAIPPRGKRLVSGSYSTAAEVLEELVESHTIMPLILEYRSLEKLRSTYIDSLPEQIHPCTERIHCSFNQSVTATGRLSCTSPNLQNIPVRSKEGKRIREAFEPQKPGWLFLGADYSQIELRILAHLSDDPELIKAFHEDGDIHKVTAAKVFGIPFDEVTSEMRSRAKAVNFGIIYGQQAFGLSKGLGIAFHDASNFIETYFQRYPKIKAYLDECKECAMRTGVATSMFGRQRLLPEINSKNGAFRAQALRFAINAPIQGTQSDIIKMAMIEIDKVFLNKGLQGKMILQIHDELLFELPENELEECKSFIKNTMENIITLKVPLKVDISVGKNWGEC